MIKHTSKLNQRRHNFCFEFFIKDSKLQIQFKLLLYSSFYPFLVVITGVWFLFSPYFILWEFPCGNSVPVFFFFLIIFANPKSQEKFEKLGKWEEVL